MLSREERRGRGDMIATYKIMLGKDKVDPRLLFDVGGEGETPRTRGEARVLDIRRYSFSHRVVNTWNSLPDSLKGVGTLLGFKIGYNEWVSGGRLGA